MFNLSSTCLQLVFNLSSTCFQLVFNLSSACLQLVFNLSSTCFQLVFSLFSTCLQLVFNLSSTCLQLVFNLSSARLQLVFKVSSMCLQCVFNLSSTGLQLVFNLSSTCLQLVFNLSSTRLQLVINLSSTCLQRVFNLSSTCLQLVFNVSSTCPQLVFNLFSTCLQLVFNSWNPYWKPSKLLGPLFGTVTWNLPEPILLLGWNLYALLGTSESSGTFTWNPCSEPRNLLEPFMIGTLTWNLGTCRNLYLEPLYLEPRNLRNPLWLEPLLGTSEPAGNFSWNPYTWNLGTFGTLLGNPYLKPRNLPEPLLGTLTRNLGTCRNLYLEPLLGTSEPAGTFTWNPYLEPRNLREPLLGTLTWNLGTCQNLARWLPQSAPGLSLARTPKLSAVGEKAPSSGKNNAKTHALHVTRAQKYGKYQHFMPLNLIKNMSKSPRSLTTPAPCF